MLVAQPMPHLEARSEVSSPDVKIHTPTPSRARFCWLAVLIVVLGVANHARSLGWGFVYDDHFQQLILRGLGGESAPPVWSLYDFGPRPGSEDWSSEWGYRPWWTESEYSVRFFRPVSSLSLLLDYAVYGRWAPGYHITNLCLFAVLLAMCFGLYLDLGVSRRAALWALAFLAFEDVNILPVCWIANRNTLLAVLFIVATIRTVHRYRRSGRRRYLPAAAICFAMACASKESGIVALPLTAAYLLFFDKNARAASWPGRALLLLRSPVCWILLAIALAFAGYYAANGYGTYSAGYALPWSSPDRYLVGVLMLVPIGLATLLLGLISDLLPMYAEYIPLAAGLSAAALAVAAYVASRCIKRTPVLGFAILWAVVSLLPVAGMEISDRLYMTASVATALLIGLFLDGVGSFRARWSARQFGRLALAGWVCFFGILLTFPATRTRSRIFTSMARYDAAIIENADLGPRGNDPRASAHNTVRAAFLLNAPSALLALTIAPTWAVLHDDNGITFYPLQLGRRPLTWTRQDAYTMTLTSQSTALLDHRVERLLRAHADPIPEGHTFETPEFVATAVVTEPNGIRTLRLRFKSDLDDSAYRFLAMRNGRLEAIAPPAVGHSIELDEVASLLPIVP